MEIKRVNLDDNILKCLIDMSRDWENEHSCFGYRTNTKDDINGNDILIAFEDSKPIGYLLGYHKIADVKSEAMPMGSKLYEINEIYVCKEYRSKGVGQALYHFAETKLASDVDYVTLCTATKDFKKIMHFYIDELGLDFFSARLFKKMSKEGK